MTTHIITMTEAGAVSLGEEEPALSLFKKRGPKKSTIRKRPFAASASDSSEYSSEDEDGRRVKRRRKAAVVSASSRVKNSSSGIQDFSVSKFVADRSAQINHTSDATKQTDWYEEGTQKEIDSKPRLSNSIALEVEQNIQDDGTYKGNSEYKSFIQKNLNAASKKVGPMKAPTNVRVNTEFDYKPDICKDYKQTGFCGYGDGCRFLHAREDVKQGWQLDREWENVTKGKKVTGGITVSSRKQSVEFDEDEDEKEAAALEGIPFACIICKESYKAPIVTKCGHYFCEACALKRFKKTPNCAACGSGTGGVFNGAKNLKKLLEKKKEREAKQREIAREDGEDLSDTDQDSEAESTH